MESNITNAFLLTFAAGFCTTIGGFIAFIMKKQNIKVLSLGLGFSAGVMIWISLTELFSEAQSSLASNYGHTAGGLAAILAFFAGIVITAMLDKFLPEDIGHQMFNLPAEKDYECNLRKQKLGRIGIFTAIAIAIHNFPEGIATFASGVSDIKLGMAIAMAIAIHNIPEGISVSLPVYHVTCSKRKAILCAFLSGMAEPLGAFLGMFLLSFILNPVTLAYLLAGVAGIMVYIAFDELLPTAREYGNGHLEILGLCAGMFVMAVSLTLLK